MPAKPEQSHEYAFQYLMEPKASEILQFAANHRWIVELRVTPDSQYVCMRRGHAIRDKAFRRDEQGRSQLVEWLEGFDYI